MTRPQRRRSYNSGVRISRLLTFVLVVGCIAFQLLSANRHLHLISGGFIAAQFQLLLFDYKPSIAEPSSPRFGDLSPAKVLYERLSDDKQETIVPLEISLSSRNRNEQPGRISVVTSSSDSDKSVSPVLPRPKRTKGTLYRCGYESQTGRLAHHLFDDYIDDTSLQDKDFRLPLFQCNASYSADDILVLSAGDCCGYHQFYYDNTTWLHTEFPGKVLYLNAERIRDQTDNHSYMISSQPSHARNVQVSFAAMAFLGILPNDKWPILTLKDTPRPRNTGQHFMAYVATRCKPFRDNLALALSALGRIHHGDCRPKTKDRRNFQRISANRTGHFKWTSNIDLYHDFRFCLVLENAVSPMYVTEKLVMAFLAGCIPIWSGTQDVWDIFHMESFLKVNPKKRASVDELLRKVQYLEANATAYDEMFHHPILANGNETLEKYFSLDDSIGKGILKHRIRVMMGLEDDAYQQIP